MSAIIERTPAIIAGEINYIKRQAQQTLLAASVEIGRKLNEAKALVPHGLWEDWLTENVDYSQSTANNLMRIATEYGDEQVSLFSGKSNSETFASLTYSQAVALFALPMDQRREFVENHDMEDLSTRELKEKIAALKAETEKRDEIIREMEVEGNELREKIGRLEEENEEAERDYNSAADELEEKQKALQDALKGKRDAEAMFDAAKKLADANAKEKEKAVKAKAAAEKKEADLMKQLNDATEEIRRLEAEAQEKPEPEQITMEAAVSEEALEAQREKIAAEEREKLQEELRAEYEKKLSAAANPDNQRCVLRFESFCAEYQRLTKAMQGLPEENRNKIRANVRSTLERMLEEMRDE
jgi:hypothetical protein